MIRKTSTFTCFWGFLDRINFDGSGAVSARVTKSRNRDSRGSRKVTRRPPVLSSESCSAPENKWIERKKIANRAASRRDMWLGSPVKRRTWPLGSWFSAVLHDCDEKRGEGGGGVHRTFKPHISAAGDAICDFFFFQSTCFPARYMILTREREVAKLLSEIGESRDFSISLPSGKQLLTSQN